jgi:iron complex outermembrane recepter protein
MTTPTPRRSVTPWTCLQRVAFASLLFLGMTIQSAVAADAPKKNYDLPPGDASTTLKQFVEQSGEQIIYMVDNVRDEQTNAVFGQFTAHEALDRMLAGTNLIASEDKDTQALVVGRKDPAPDPAPVPVENARQAALKRPAQGDEEEVIELSPFTVHSDSNAGRYQPNEASSGGRVRINLMESSQSISVITREFMDDIGTARVLDSAKYASAVTESFIPNGLDFLNIRGFQTRGQTVDSFNTDAQLNLDPFIIDRYEIVKGPNAVLSPAGIPGGTINLVSKKPKFSDFGSVSTETSYSLEGHFGGLRSEFDYNRVFGENVAVRLLLAGENTENYVDSYSEGWMVMPMLTYRFSPGTQLTLQIMAREAEIQNYMGLPIDPSSGTTNEAKILEGVDRFLNIYEDNFRWEDRREGRMLFTSNLNEYVSTRLAGRFTIYDAYFAQNNPTPVGGSSATGGAFDPHTGLYTPGITYGAAPAFTPAAATPQSRSFTRSGRLNPFRAKHFDVQNDFVFMFENDWIDATTPVGWAFSYSDRDNNNYTRVKPAIDIDTYAAGSHSDGVITARSTAQYSENDRKQIYIAPTVKLFDDRLVMNVGYTWDWTTLRVKDYRLTPATNSFAAPSAEHLSYGIVVKPVENVSLFYNYAEQGTPLAASSIAAGDGPLQEGAQDEYGIRTVLFDKKLTITITYFDITQTNNPVSNPGNTVTPAPNPLLPPILTDRYSKGWEFEFAGSLTDSLSVVGNYTDFKNRDVEYDLPLRANADRSGAIWMRYDFKNFDALEGLAVGFGANYLAKRPGEVPSGFAAASTPDNPIPRQPSFYIPERILVDMAVSYKLSRAWSFQFNIDNLLNEEYLAGAENRFIVWVGAPMNMRFKATYSF